jgi:hypothetical protein
VRVHPAGRFLSAMALLVVIALGGVSPVWGQSAAPETLASVRTETTVEFPVGMRFSTEIPIPDGTSVDHVELLYQVGSDDTLNLTVAPADSYSASDSSVTVDMLVDIQSTFTPLGVTLGFHWEVSSNGQVIVSTQVESTVWEDTRFDWQAISTAQVTLHSYDLSHGFAQQVLDSAQLTMTELEQRFDLPRLDPVSIWVYGSAADFSGTRLANAREAVAGMSYPGASVIAAVIPDGNDRELGRVLPHEISHQALYQATLNPFNAPPLWFDEGLATHVQRGGTDHYPDMVIRAKANDALFDISSLTVSFPYQPAQATLAYASSWSMVAYIEETYGDDGMARLIDAFGQGVTPDEAIVEALGVGIDELNVSWHDWVDEQGPPSAIAA